MSFSEILDPNRIYKEPLGLKAERTVHRVTFSPSSANPGEKLYVDIPKLAENVVIVPDSVGLLFNLEITKGQANNTTVNNVGRNLISNMCVLFGGKTLQDTHRYDLFSTYQDLFLTKEERENRVLEGISDETLRKHRTASGNKGTVAEYVKLAGIYGKKFRIPINHPILDNHGAFYPRALTQTLEFQISLTGSNNIGVTSDNTKDYKYTISNLELEYTCINSDKLAREAHDAYQAGRGFFYEDVLHHEFIISKPNDSIINKSINTSNRSVSGILCLFQETFTAGDRDSEKFVNPDITSININIDGMPNQRYSKGMLPTDFWQAVKNRFGLSDNITQKDFYNDKFAVWIDLKTTPDHSIHANGTTTKDGINLQINRKVGGSGNLTCHMFTVSDAALLVGNNDFKEIKK